MMNFIKIVLLKFFGLFPDSPFADNLADMDMSSMQYLTWFFPLDVCLNLFGVWINCMLVVLVLMLAKKYLMDKLISLLMSLPLPIK